MRAISPVEVGTAAFLGSGFFVGFRLYGNGIWIVAALLVLMMAGQRLLMHITQGNAIDQAIGPRVRAAASRNLFPFIFATGLWLNALVPYWYTQGNAFVLMSLAFISLFLTVVFLAVTTTIFTLMHKRDR